MSSTTNHRSTPQCGFTTTIIGASFEQALSKTIGDLKVEGSGTLSDIDIQHAWKNS
ncbi:MAG: hypothetical protein ABI859_16175 [Pseudomonadota bacterium]